uniref:Uncharacterized protein n=1 Tax=Panagrolaimus sp. ES5 TaxID=591445 RepID=A0AC34GSJ4_9BILA
MIYGMEGQSPAFQSFIVSRYHRIDKIDANKWNIIYHDFIGTRIAVIGVTSITCVGIGIAFCCADFYVNGKLTTERGIQVQRDFEELGAFAYTPFTRSQVKVLPMLYNREAYYYQIFAFGNIKINNKSAIINTESFEQPTIKSYMFGERNTMPEKLLSSNTSLHKAGTSKSKQLPPPPMF